MDEEFQLKIKPLIARNQAPKLSMKMVLRGIFLALIWISRRGFKLELGGGQIVLLSFCELADKIQCVLGRHLAVLFPLDAGEFDSGH